jgi:hypothetical protein
MAISVEGLYSLCSKNIVEIKFVRRNKFVSPSTRRMLATIDQKLLKSTFGINTLNYKKPKYPPPYNAKAKGLCTLWDILMQDWRNVPTESIEVVSIVSTTPMKDFLDWFENVIKPMSPASKINFMSK